MGHCGRRDLVSVQILPNFKFLEQIFGAIYKKKLSELRDECICWSEKSQCHRGHKKGQCEINQALVMINLYVKFNMHSSYAKQVIVLKVEDRRVNGRARWRQ